MKSFDWLDTLYVVWVFLFGALLIIHFSLRKWHFHTAIRLGPVIYALGVPASVISVLQIVNAKPWWLWLGGCLCLAWGIFGYTIEYVKRIQWRNPPLWLVFIPYLFLYLSTLMFYWWPLWNLSKPLWITYTILFIISTILNSTSHHVGQTVNLG